MSKINSVKKKARRAGYYKLGYVSDKLLEIPIDYSRARVSDFELKKLYANLGLRYYSSKADFISKNPNLKNKADEYWRQYKIRDELIARGQYESARAMLYMRAHIEKLESLLGVAQGDNAVLKSIIENLKNVPADKLTDLIGISSGERGALTTYLPNIGDIYMMEGTIPSKEAGELLSIGKDEFNERQNKLLSDYQSAFRMAGINWIYPDIPRYDDLDPNAMPTRPLDETSEFVVKRNKAVMRYSRRHNYNITYDEYSDRIAVIDKYKNKYATPLERAYGIVQERTTNKVLGYPDTEHMRNIVLDYYKSHTKYIRTTKSGRQYIPFTKRSISDYIIKNLK